MVLTLHVLASILLLLVGATVFEWGIRAIRNRGRVVTAFAGTEQELAARVFVVFWMALTLLAGASMMIASVLLWINPISAALVALWPLAFLMVINTAKKLKRTKT